MSSPALLHALYRQTRRRSNVVVKHFDGEVNFHLALRAVFGLALEPGLPIDGCYTVTSKELISVMFRRKITPSEDVAGRVAAAFDALQRLEQALPSDEVDQRYFVGRADVKFGTGTTPAWVKTLGTFKPRVVLPSDKGNHFPLRRHGIPEEPFYPVFLSTSWTKFLFLTPFLQQAVSPHVEAQFPYNATTNLSLLKHLPTKTTCTTHGIEVECRTEYVGLESSPAPPHPGLESAAPRPSHVFRYVIAIRNNHPRREPTSATVALVSRHWNFIDAETSQITEVVGPGVVGEFPLLEPGDRYVYQSGTSMFGGHGAMTGTFQFILTRRGVSGEPESIPVPLQVDVKIAPTALTSEVRAIDKIDAADNRSPSPQETNRETKS